MFVGYSAMSSNNLSNVPKREFKDSRSRDRGVNKRRDRDSFNARGKNPRNFARRVQRSVKNGAFVQDAVLDAEEEEDPTDVVDAKDDDLSLPPTIKDQWPTPKMDSLPLSKVWDDRPTGAPFISSFPNYDGFVSLNMLRLYNTGRLNDRTLVESAPLWMHPTLMRLGCHLTSLDRSFPSNCYCGISCQCKPFSVAISFKEYASSGIVVPSTRVLYTFGPDFNLFNEMCAGGEVYYRDVPRVACVNPVSYTFEREVSICGSVFKPLLHYASFRGIGTDGLKLHSYRGLHFMLFMSNKSVCGVKQQVATPYDGPFCGDPNRTAPKHNFECTIIRTRDHRAYAVPIPFVDLVRSKLSLLKLTDETRNSLVQFLNSVSQQFNVGVSARMATLEYCLERVPIEDERLCKTELATRDLRRKVEAYSRFDFSFIMVTIYAIGIMAAAGLDKFIYLLNYYNCDFPLLHHLRDFCANGVYSGPRTFQGAFLIVRDAIVSALSSPFVAGMRVGPNASVFGHNLVTVLGLAWWLEEIVKTVVLYFLVNLLYLFWSVDMVIMSIVVAIGFASIEFIEKVLYINAAGRHMGGFFVFLRRFPAYYTMVICFPFMFHIAIAHLFMPIRMFLHFWYNLIAFFLGTNAYGTCKWLYKVNNHPPPLDYITVSTPHTANSSVDSFTHIPVKQESERLTKVGVVDGKPSLSSVVQCTGLDQESRLNVRSVPSMERVTRCLRQIGPIFCRQVPVACISGHIELLSGLPRQLGVKPANSGTIGRFSLWFRTMYIPYIVGALGIISPISFSEFLLKQPPQKRLLYVQSKTLYDKGLVHGFATRKPSIFNKVEKLDANYLDSDGYCAAKKPRIITNTNKNQAFRTGPFFVALSTRMTQVFNEHSSLFYASKTESRAIGKYVADVKEWHLYENDCSKWDGHQRAECLRLLIELFKYLGLPGDLYREYLEDINFCAGTKAFAKGFDYPFNAVVSTSGTQGSGRPETSCGNTLMNFAYHLFADYEQYGEDVVTSLTRLRIMALGDDNVSCSLNPWSVAVVEKLFKELGHEPKVKAVTIQTVEFCSQLFLPCVGGYVLFPKLGRFLSRLPWHIIPTRPVTTAERIGRFKCDLLSRRFYLRNLPYFGPLLKNLLSLCDGYSVVNDSYNKEWNYHHIEGEVVPNNDTMEFLTNRYGVFPSKPPVIKRLDSVIDDYFLQNLADIDVGPLMDMPATQSEDELPFRPPAMALHAGYSNILLPFVYGGSSVRANHPDCGRDDTLPG